MSVLGGLSNFAFGTNDWKNAWHEASQGHWGEAAKSAGWGALALGSTAAMAVPLVGEGVKGAAVGAEAAHLATAGRAAEGAATAARGAEVAKSPVQAYASSNGKGFLADNFGVGNSVGGRSPVATLTRPKVAPDQPLWRPGKTPFEPAPPVGPKTPLKFDPTTPQKVTRSAPRGVDVVNDAPDAVGLAGKAGKILPGAAAVAATSLGSGLSPEPNTQPEPNKLNTKTTTDESTKKKTTQDNGLDVGQQTAVIPRIY